MGKHQSPKEKTNTKHKHSPLLGEARGAGRRGIRGEVKQKKTAGSGGHVVKKRAVTSFEAENFYRIAPKDAKNSKNFRVTTSEKAYDLP